MKEIKKEIKTYIVAYLSEDGHEFNSKEECEKYEKTAIGVLNAEYQKLIVKRTNEYAFTGGFGSEDNVIEIVKLNNKEEAKIVKQMCLYYNSHLNAAEHLKNKERIFNIIDRAVGEKDYLPICRSYDDDCFWIDNTVNGVINNMLESCKNPE